MRGDVNADLMEQASYIKRDPITDEISWPPTDMMQELARLGLVCKDKAAEDDQ